MPHSTSSSSPPSNHSCPASKIPRAGRRLISLFVFLACAVAFAATDGNFTGKIVDGSAFGSTGKWIYVQGAKGSARRVDISGARVTYSSAVHNKDRSSRPINSLRPGTEVRVTASQDEVGEWRATEVRILAIRN